jgi:CheY-like chemotaxis protein
VLLVEGSTLARLTYKAALEGRGYAMEETGTGREALAKAVSAVYAAVVLNLRLREMSGLGLLETIRAMPGYRTVPVIVLAGGDDAALGRWAVEREKTRAACSNPSGLKTWHFWWTSLFATAQNDKARLRR